MEKDNFSEFVRQYELSKTLRFELKPIWETSRLLEEENVFKKDKAIQEKYLKTKGYFDLLHRDFVSESLTEVIFWNIEEYSESFIAFKKIHSKMNAKQKKEATTNFEKQEKILRKSIWEIFNTTAHKWTTEKYSWLKNKNIKFLDEEAVFEKVLFEKYGEDSESFINIEQTDQETGEITQEKVSIFLWWKGFTGYFGKFFETRKNFYKDDGKAGRISTRIINENLRKYCENLETITFIKKNHPNFSFEDALEETNFSLPQIQDLNFYGKNCLLQEGIDSYNEHFVWKVKSAINFYKQTHKAKVPYLKTLDKQILSEKEVFLEEIADEKDLLERLEKIIIDWKQKVEAFWKIIKSLSKDNEKTEYDTIFISKKWFETISRKWSAETFLWSKLLADWFKEITWKKIQEKQWVWYKFPEFIPLSVLKKSLENIPTADTQNFWKERYKNFISEENSSSNMWEEFLALFWYEYNSLLSQHTWEEQERWFNIYLRELQHELSQEKLNTWDIFVEKVKNYADCLLHIYQFSKCFAVEKKNHWDSTITVNDEFYEDYKDYYSDCYDTIIKPYNLFRNYFSKKPWAENKKWKLNFSLPTLWKWWDKNKETSNACLIFRKWEQYFLWIMKKWNTHLFADKNKDNFLYSGEWEQYEKVIYKLLPWANKMLPKVFFSKSKIDFFAPSEKVIEIRNYSTHTKSGTPQKGYTKKDFNLGDCHTIIDFFKESLGKHEEWRDFTFAFWETSHYKDISQFYRDVEKWGYKISFEKISQNYIQEKNNAWELFLFQIRNKDWNLKDGKKKTGTKNLHTMYFEHLFSEENAKNNFILKLNGEAEIFFRPKTNEEKLWFRKDNSWKKVVKHRRFAQDKVFFHIPLTANRATGKISDYQFNQKINNFLDKNTHINIIWIDRWEKHLAYYSIISRTGKIIDSGSFNVMTNSKTGIGVDYHYKLSQKEKKRLEERKNWKAIESIKDLKKWYISLVVRKIADLAIEHNAIIILEDLNMRFKQIRWWIEKSVYQQLEKALIDKMSYLIEKKELDPTKAWNLLKAYQLVAPFESFQKMGKQTGIMFYTTASYTSKIDPISWWRPHLYLKYKNETQWKELLLEKFKSVIYNSEKQRFEFTYIHNDATWTLCSNVERWYGHRTEKNNNQFWYDKFPKTGEGSITEKLHILLSAKISNISGMNILEQLENLDATEIKNLIFYFRLISQIRNTDWVLYKKIEELKNNETYNFQESWTKKMVYDSDFILSPVEPFYDSRRADDFGKNLPKNGDDNGAYNIARKGIIMLDNIDAFYNLSGEEQDKQKFPKLFVSNDEWDEFCRK